MASTAEMGVAAQVLMRDAHVSVCTLHEPGIAETDMEKNHHLLSELFLQLGLPAGPEQINAFVAAHSPLPHGTSLSEATFWNTAQAAFLREALEQDSDWVEAVDQLNEALRQAPLPNLE
ncbi:DUF2789 domain-containing protein [Perlucidibaca piscinae]|uniref:DUF2789 domain-containing protein n=1 Tax=Perlucidibaca piscinae TaxID=392589 RepID=UPI002ADE369F|nr:DUF2789 domain-containing protein [Perlucidibaca piscinae]